MLISQPVYVITCQGESVFFLTLDPSSCFVPEIALQLINKGIEWVDVVMVILNDVHSLS